MAMQHLPPFIPCHMLCWQQKRCAVISYRWKGAERAMKGKAVTSHQKSRIGFFRPSRWRGLQAGMTFSYVWVPITAAFLLELLLLVFVTFVIGTAYSNVLFPQLAMQVARQYAFVAALQANGSSLNPQSTFLPGQADSLLPMPDEGTSL